MQHGPTEGQGHYQNRNSPLAYHRLHILRPLLRGSVGAQQCFPGRRSTECVAGDKLSIAAIPLRGDGAPPRWGRWCPGASLPPLAAGLAAHRRIAVPVPGHRLGDVLAQRIEAIRDTHQVAINVLGLGEVVVIGRQMPIRQWVAQGLQGSPVVHRRFPGGIVAGVETDRLGEVLVMGQGIALLLLFGAYLGQLGGGMAAEQPNQAVTKIRRLLRIRGVKGVKIPGGRAQRIGVAERPAQGDQRPLGAGAGTGFARISQPSPHPRTPAPPHPRPPAPPHPRTPRCCVYAAGRCHYI